MPLELHLSVLSLCLVMLLRSLDRAPYLTMSASHIDSASDESALAKKRAADERYAPSTSHASMLLMEVTRLKPALQGGEDVNRRLAELLVQDGEDLSSGRD